MAQLGFGSGILVGTPTIDINGNSISNPTPTEFGVLQDCSIDISKEIKELFGNYTFPVAIASGKGKIQGKAKFASLNGIMLNNLIFGVSYTNLLIGQVKDGVGTAVPASSPYTITPTVPGSGTWLTDMGVTYANGQPLVRVASAPTVGQYSVAAGVYTFAAADTGVNVRINFQYSATSTIARKTILTNPLMGASPTFRADLFIPFQGNNFVLTLNACMSSKISIPTKIDDYTIPEFDFSAAADANNNIGTLSLAG